MCRLMLLLFTVLASARSVNADWLYWTDRTGPVNSGVIQRMNLSSNVIETLKTGLYTPDSVVVDRCHQKMYWSENNPHVRGRVFRAGLDGTQTETIIQGDIASRYLALDLRHGYLYSCSRGDVVERCRLDGSDHVVLTSVRQPAGFALDVVGGKMYWTEFSDSRICRANLDGSMKEVLIATGERPFGVAVDQTNRHVYWTEQVTNPCIRRANLDGSNVTNIVSQGLSHLSYISAHDGLIYWSSGAGINGKIQRLGCHGVEDVIIGLPLPLGIDYVAAPAHCIPSCRCRFFRRHD